MLRTMSIPDFAVVLAFWLFILYIFWTIAKALKHIGQGLHEVAQALKDRH